MAAGGRPLGSNGAPLLLVVQMNVDPEHERAFNDWYHCHVPHLLEVPGYRWGRRYAGIFGPVRYLALYEIADRSWLPALLGAEPGARPGIVNDEFERFGALQGLEDVLIRVFEQISGPPFTPRLLDSDHPVSVVLSDARAEVEAEFNRWYDHSHVPGLLEVPGYRSGLRFRLVDDPALAHHGTRFRYLALYEIEDEASVPAISDPDSMSQEARDEFERFRSVGLPMLSGELSWNIYRPLAKHWPARL
jgi:hypothetical protein